MKKLLKIVLAVLFAFSLAAPLTSVYAEDEEGTGDLKITYTTANDEDDDFDVEIEIKQLAASGRYDNNFEGEYDSTAGTIEFINGIATVYLHSGESITIYNLPKGENSKGDYIISVETEGYTMSGNEYATIEIGSITECNLTAEKTGRDVNVCIKWIDQDSTNRPDEVEVSYYGHTYGEESNYDMIGVLNAENGWSYTFEGVLGYYDWFDYDSEAFYDDDGKIYKVELSGNATDGYVLTCTQILDTSTTVTVVWNDNDDASNLRPYYLNIELLMNGDVVATGTAREAYYYIDEDGNRIQWGEDWVVNFSRFDIYSSDVTEKNFTINISRTVEGYTYTITGSFEEGYVVTYTLDGINSSTTTDDDETTTTNDDSTTTNTTDETETTSSEVTEASTSTAVQTGDESSIALWSMLMLVSVIGFMAYRKRRQIKN